MTGIGGMNIRSLAVISTLALLLNNSFAQAPAVKGGNTPAPQHQSAVVPVPRNDKTQKRFEELTDRVMKNAGNVDVLFVGDSITQGWEGTGGKPVWQKYYGKMKAVNIGISGDQTQHVLWRLDHGNADGLKPKVTVLMIGTNN
ncbi:MAG: lipolytic protein family, partial [Verrucomicrobiales bacterium]|nr:lipolytic protein family [Verrucomicrobiales bacterium]